MKVLVFACLIALCYAQPAPTEIPETFTSKVNHGNKITSWLNFMLYYVALHNKDEGREDYHR